MKIDMTDLLNSITENLKRIDYIKPKKYRILIYIWIR